MSAVRDIFISILQLFKSCKDRMSGLYSAFGYFWTSNLIIMGLNPLLGQLSSSGQEKMVT